MTTRNGTEEANVPIWRDAAWVQGLLKDAFGPGFFGFLAFAVVSGLICYAVVGGEAVASALAHDIDVILALLPRVAVAISVAALLWVMLPRDKVSHFIGRDSGLRGLVIATMAGTITPGGPSSAYALLAMLGAAGADRGAMIAYIAAWATLGVQRMLVWDIPFMGGEFAIVRFAVCLPLPIMAGLIARRLPLALRLRDQPQMPKSTPKST
jgi:uncharacterized membrane protein YraQ (UPF0718 family)